jgi:hypothetical protein
LSYFYCLPNKIFEYLMADIPFVVSDFPEMGKIVKRTNGGWLIDPNSISLLETIKKISINNIKEKKQNILKEKPNFGWEIEEKKYVSIYDRIKLKLIK